jgi:lysophospholipase L1-like esterase
VRKVRWLAVAAVLTFAVGATVSSASSRPGQYYLALGDSIAYGFQPTKAKAGLPPSGFNTGYVDVVAARLHKLAPSLRVVNYGCPGESTTTFVAACPASAEGIKLHDPYRVAQQTAALAFLRAHRGQVNPITVSLGGNDLFDQIGRCKEKLACAASPRARAQFLSRLRTILRRLHAAAPNATIVVTGIWNFDVAHLKDTDPQDQLFRSYNSAIAKAARGRARFADTYPIFNPDGSLAKEKARICSMTFICSHDDPHPTNAGYKAIANAVLAAAGY